MIIAPMAMPRKAERAPGRPFLLLLSVVLALLLAPLVVAGAATDTLHRKAEELQQIRGKIAQVQKSLQADRGRQGQLQSAVEQSEQKLQTARDALRQLDAEVAEQNQKLARARADQQAAEAKLHAQQAALAAQLRAAYMEPRHSRLQLLLSAQDPSVIGRMLGYFEALDRARADAIAAVRAQLAQVTVLAQTIDTERRRLAGLQQRQQQAVAALRQTQQARAQAVAELKTRIADKSETLTHLQAAQQQVEKLLQTLRRTLRSEPYALGNHTPFARLKGRLPWPVRGRLLARFGAAKRDPRLHWRGIWIAAPEDAPVRACARGRVVYVGWISSYGLIVLLQHDHDYFSLYGHAERADVRVGDTVEAGQVIARAGETGGHDHSGVYLELRHGKDTLNPEHWLAR